MNKNFKSFILSFIFLSLNISLLKSFDINSSVRFAYRVSSIAKIPVCGAVLLAHATSNKNLETKFKIIESAIQLTNDVSFHKAYYNKVGYLDTTFLVFEVFRLLKYLKKFKYNKSKVNPEKKPHEQAFDIELDGEDLDTSNLKSPEKLERSMNAFNLTEEEAAELLQDGNFSLDDPVDVFEDESLSDNVEPKSLAFKVKIAVCLLLLVDEVLGVYLHSIVADPFLHLAGRCLRYFLLSESGSLEAKVYITLFLCSLIRFFWSDGDGYNILGLYDRLRYDRDGYDRKGYDREGYDFLGFDREGYNRDGYNIAGYDREGYDRIGIHRFTGLDRDGYNMFGYDREGYNRDGYNHLGYDRHGRDRDFRFRHRYSVLTRQNVANDDQDSQQLLKQAPTTQGRTQQDFEKAVNEGDGVVDCPICRVDFEPGEEVIMPNCCNGVLHEECFNRSVEDRRNENYFEFLPDINLPRRCPLCSHDHETARSGIGGRFQYVSPCS